MTDDETKINEWRKNYQKALLADDGWLSIIALNWLSEGSNLIGSSEQSLVALPKTRVPEELGVLRLSGNSVIFQSKNALVNYQNCLVNEVHIELSDNANSDHFVIGDFAFSVIRRGSQFGVRVFDKEASSRKNFQGCQWFPINSKYCLDAEFIPYIQPRAVTITNIIGGTYQSLIPGKVRFVLDGQFYDLLPTQNKGKFSFVFKDLTSQTLSYPAGRFLSTDLPQDGKLTLDFNKAYNPPCAFTPYATCPLPLKENHLNIQILAGEQYSSLD